MNVTKFFGTNSREALREVKRALGGDAVILSNRAVEGGVEIAALAPHELASLAARPAAQKRSPSPASTPTPAAGTAPAAPTESWANHLVSEIKMMRSVLEEQLGGLVWGDLQRHEPIKARLLRELLEGGFSPLLARNLIQHLPAGSDYEQSLKWVHAALARNLLVADEDAIVARGGVYALMGPTGVGKTTTTAKLAARCVVRHGADKLALLTTDSYRVGGHEQLRIYGRILGVPVHAIRDGDDLRITLSELEHKHMVLIDTVGMGQRDQMVAEQVAMLCGAAGVQRLLLLAATGSPENLDDVVRAYQGTGLNGAILTKVDEAIMLGGALDVVIRHKLTLNYIANGQRVPEDLHAINRDHLLQRALRRRPVESAYALGDAEMPALLAGARGALTRAEAHLG